MVTRYSRAEADLARLVAGQREIGGAGMVTAIDGRGTGEDTWRPWLDGLRLSTLDPADLGTPLVVAPHPDDEILGIGGLLALAGGAEVVAVTDGEGSHPGSTASAAAEMRRRRPAETVAALARLGLPGAVTHRLRQPDGAVAEAELTAALCDLLSPGRCCLVTWRHDGHPDHEATGRATALACTARGARLLEYPVWAWHWAAPGDPRLPWARAYRIPLPEPVRAAKAAAIAEFRSQLEPLGPAAADAPILPPHVVARFHRPYELVFGP